MSTKLPDDKTLIPLLLTKDKAITRQFITFHYPQMLMIARAIAGSVIADEVVQEAWVSIFKSLPKFQQKSALKTWIMRIVANEAKTRLKKESRSISLEGLEAVSKSPFSFDQSGSWSKPPAHWHQESPDALIHQEELHDCLEKILSHLPASQRSTFILKEIGSHTLDEICNVLEVSESNVRVLLHRARTKLLAAVDRYQETGEC
ncbi:MAG: RNA polymerase sigma factor [Methylococcales bacterium]|nr:RNA polymerase sigma factor [Methylococcales bacterium]